MNVRLTIHQQINEMKYNLWVARLHPLIVVLLAALKSCVLGVVEANFAYFNW